jgi:hypothetical protein
MTTEERNAKMEALGIQAGSPAAKRFIADNETNEEAIERCAEELKASGQKVVPSGESQRAVPPGGPQSKPPIEQKTLTTSDNERLLIESIKQTEHLKSISNNVKFFFYLTVFSALLYLVLLYFS